MRSIYALKRNCVSISLAKLATDPLPKICEPRQLAIMLKLLQLKLGTNPIHKVRPHETDFTVSTVPILRTVDVPFGSKADICTAPAHVRFTPNSDRESRHPQTVMSALPSRADMCSATSDVG